MKMFWTFLNLSTLAIALASAALAAPGDERGPPPGGPGAPGGPGGRRMPPPPHPLERALDLDGDREISADEIAKAVDSLKKLDKDGNGKLSRDELRPPPPPDRGGPPEGPPGGAPPEPPPPRE